MTIKDFVQLICLSIYMRKYLNTLRETYPQISFCQLKNLVAFAIIYDNTYFYAYE